MKNETARREIESLDYYLQNHTDDYSEESHTAMMMAIKALGQEPCEDAISRQAVRHILNHEVKMPIKVWKKVFELVDDLPPVTPQPKIDWIPVSERLPEENGLYLVYTEEQPFVCPFNDGEFFIDEVLEWMPLPKPYEPQERSDNE